MSFAAEHTSFDYLLTSDGMNINSMQSPFFDDSSDFECQPTPSDEGSTDQNGTISSNSSEAQSKGNILPISKKRKRRRIYRGLTGFPTVARTDYRRLYPTMWVNVVNQNDSSIFRSLLEYSTIKNCVHQNDFHTSVAKIFPLFTRCSSRDLIVLHCAYKSVMAPDTMCRLNGCYIRRTKDVDGCQIIMNISYHGTILYDIDIPDPRIAEIKEMNAEPRVLVSLFNKLELSKYKVPVAQPIDMEVTGELTISMDCNHSVTGFYYKNKCWTAIPTAGNSMNQLPRNQVFL